MLFITECTPNISTFGLHGSALVALSSDATVCLGKQTRYDFRIAQRACICVASARDTARPVLYVKLSRPIAGCDSYSPRFLIRLECMILVWPIDLGKNIQVALLYGHYWTGSHQKLHTRSKCDGCTFSTVVTGSRYREITQSIDSQLRGMAENDAYTWLPIN